MESCSKNIRVELGIAYYPHVRIPGQAPGPLVTGDLVIARGTQARIPGSPGGGSGGSSQWPDLIAPAYPAPSHLDQPVVQSRVLFRLG